MTFTITKKDQDFEAIRHAALAIPDDMARPAMSVIHVQNGTAYGYDGFRIHFAHTTLSEGQYKVVKLLKSKIELKKLAESEEYPSIDLSPVIPPKNLTPTIIYNFNPLNLDQGTAIINGAVAIASKDQRVIVVLNTNYLYEALEQWGYDITVQYDSSVAYPGPVRITYKSYHTETIMHAIIMPLSIPSDIK